MNQDSALCHGTVVWRGNFINWLVFFTIVIGTIIILPIMYTVMISRWLSSKRG